MQAMTLHDVRHFRGSKPQLKERIGKTYFNSDEDSAAVGDTIVVGADSLKKGISRWRHESIPALSRYLCQMHVVNNE